MEKSTKATLTKPNVCATIKKKVLFHRTEETVEEKIILCPDCGKLLLKVTGNSRATLICWCRRCRTEKTIPVEP